MFRSQNFEQNISRINTPTNYTKFIVFDTSFNLHVIDIASESIDNSYNIPELGVGYSCIAGNGVIAYTNYGGAKVDFISSTTFGYLGNTPVDSYGWGVEYINSKFWVCCNFNVDNIYIIDSITFGIDATLTDTTLPTGISYGNNKMVVSSYTPSSVNGLYDTNSNSLITTVSNSNDNASATAFGDGKFIISNYLSNNVNIINSSTNSIITTISVGTGPYGDKIGYGNGYFAVANFNSSNVSIIQSSTNSVVATVSTPTSPFNVAYGNGKFGVTTGANQVCFIDATTHTVLSNLNIGTTIYAICAI